MAKYRPIKVNVTPEHYDELLEKAQSNDQTIAQFVRSELNIDLGIKPRTRKKRSDAGEFNKVDPSLLYQVSKIGNNLNQIAKHLNSGTSQDVEILSTLLEIRNEMQRLTK